MRSARPLLSLLALGAIFATSAVRVSAQEAAPASQGPPRVQVVSANPFGLLLTWFNAEYERKVSESVSAGVGGSTFSDDEFRYVNADVFFRYYPSGRPLQGLAFGIKLGSTTVTDEGTFFGFGFDTNYSWLLGKKDNVYVGLGFGLKRLYGTSDTDLGLEFIPTVRLINLGYAF